MCILSVGLFLSIEARAQAATVINGDVNSDGVVNIYDASLLTSGYHTARPELDANHDGIVDSQDFSILRGTYAQHVLPPVLYVATNGNDANSGAFSAPLKTLQAATRLVQPGQLIYVRGGVYDNVHALIQKSGTAQNPILVSSYPGEKVILDGGGDKSAIVSIYNSSYITVSNLELRNSGGRGLGITNGSHITIENNIVHHTVGVGMNANGDYITFKGNELYDGVLSNKDNAIGPGGGWGTGLSSWAKPDGSRSSHIDFINNTVHDMWGECLAPFHLNNTIINGNKIYNCFSVDIYLDNTADATVTSNYLYETDPSHRRNGQPAVGVLMGNESYTVGEQNTPDQNFLIANNVITHVRLGFGFWVETIRTTANTYRNVKFFNNTMSDATVGIRLNAVMPGQELPSGNEVINNLIENGASVGDAAGTAFSNNNFIGSNPVGVHATSFDPNFVNNTALGNPTGFKVRSSSPVIGKAMPLAQVNNDFEGKVRPVAPTLGAYEP